MVLKIIGVTIGVIAIIVMASAAPDLQRYMRIRSM
jgi:hypothetical protein